MPFSCHWEPKGVYLKFSGIVSEQEIFDSDDAMYDDPRFADIDYFIWDACDVTSLVMSSVQVDITAVRDMAISLKKDRLKCAFVATEQMIINQLQHYLEKSLLLRSQWQLALFENVEQARKWLTE